ncbi:MAG TPA: N-acetyltransferase [Sphingomonadaceae bacterium]
MSGWNIRPERTEDATAIAALVTAAFRSALFSGGNEAEIVERLRADGDLAVSLVAENLDRAVIGHVAFSPIAVSDGSGGWYALGPISVIPLRQRVGIGSTLSEAGLARLRELGAAGCVVFGDPNYYARLGFAHDPALTCRGPHPEYLQRIVLAGDPPHGTVSFAPAFGA